MPSIFEKYNLKQVINTSGRMTALGVSTPRPEVVQAAMDGMNQPCAPLDYGCFLYKLMRQLKAA
jgi:seryl-tRNA(Sec) selenium transferase